MGRKLVHKGKRVPMRDSNLVKALAYLEKLRPMISCCPYCHEIKCDDDCELEVFIERGGDGYGK